MPVKNDRQYRMMLPMAVDETTEYQVRGYAATFEPYFLYRDPSGDEIYELFTKDCFSDCDMSDVIMQFDHEGRVFARQSNGTLNIRVDENGLAIDADLSRTELAKSLYEDIAAGMITKMSWGFNWRKEPEYDIATRTLIWQPGSIRKVFDVSAVSLPANNDTTINARALTDGVIESALKEVQEAEEAKRKQIELFNYWRSKYDIERN